MELVLLSPQFSFVLVVVFRFFVSWGSHSFSTNELVPFDPLLARLLRIFGPQCSSTSYFIWPFYLFFYYFVFETRVWRKQKKTQPNTGIYDEFIYNHWDDTIAGGVFIPRGYNKPSSLHFCVDMSYHWYGHNYKFTVYKTLSFWNTKAFLPQE